MASHPNARLSIEGVGFWMPTLAGWPAARAVLRGEKSAPSTLSARPSCALLAPTERRRAPDTVAVALEVAGEACRSAGEPRRHGVRVRIDALATSRSATTCARAWRRLPCSSPHQVPQLRAQCRSGVLDDRDGIQRALHGHHRISAHLRSGLADCGDTSAGGRTTRAVRRLRHSGEGGARNHGEQRGASRRSARAGGRGECEQRRAHRAGGSSRTAKYAPRRRGRRMPRLPRAMRSRIASRSSKHSRMARAASWC